MRCCLFTFLILIAFILFLIYAILFIVTLAENKKQKDHIEWNKC